MFSFSLYTTIYLFRHGDTYQTKNKLPYKDQAVSATIIPESEEYLKKIGNYLKDKDIQYAVTSEFPRCMQSAKVVGKQLGINFSIDKRLNEYDPIYLPGESEKHFQERVDSFLSEIQRKKFSSVVICTHGAVISFIKHKLINTKAQWNSLDYPAPGILLIISGEKVASYDFRT